MGARSAVIFLLCGFSISAAACSVSDIEITHFKAGFVRQCDSPRCVIMKGVATLKNKCSESIGVQIKITGFGKDDQPIATRDLWPASIRNIAPGNFNFSLDQWLDYDPKMKKFSVEPVDIRKWK